MMSVNVLGTYLCCREIVPRMRRQGTGGRIINMASGTALKGVPGALHYVTSKGGIIALTRSLARELGKDNITVNAIAPGFFPTALTAPVVNDPKKWQANADQTFIGRNGALEDLRGVAIFLASRASNYITGQTIFVDGGFSAG